MAELPGLQAALREHEARLGGLLAAQQEKLLRASLEQFFGRPPLLGAIAPATIDEEEQLPLALGAIAPASRETSRLASKETSREADLAAERVWWTEAIKGLFLQQMQQMRGCVEEEAQKQTHALQELRGCLAAGVLPGAGDRLGALQQPPGQAQEMGTHELVERQGGELRDLRRAVAGLEALLRPVGVDKSEAAAEEPKSLSRPFSDSPDWTPTASTPAGRDDRTRGLSFLSDDDDGDSDDVALEPAIAERRISRIISDPKIRTIQGARLYARAICQSRHFVLLTACMIISNSVLLGIETNETMTSPELAAPDGVGYTMANALFALVFLLELFIRWFGDGARFLSPRNSDFLWNCFDTLLVTITVTEKILVLCSVDVDIISMGFLRLVRLIRLTQMMRAFKLVRELKELRIMATGLMNSFRPLLWASLLIVFLTYMAAVFIAQVVADFQRAAPGAELAAERTFETGMRDADVDVEERQRAQAFIDNNLSNLVECMYTLFEALTGGRDWGELAEPFRHIHWMLVVCLVLYIIIGVFCLLNLLTAVFLEAAQRMDDVTEHIYAKRDWMYDIKCFFLSAVEDMSKLNGDLSPKRISRASFIKLMKSSKTVKFLEDNGVDLCFTDESRVGELFDIMDTNGNGDVDVDEFVKSLYNLKGPARALDLMLEHQKTMNLITSLQDRLGEGKAGGGVGRNAGTGSPGVVGQAACGIDV